MSLYRRISVRMWGDKRFRRLSAPAPNAQTLWVYLMTGPHTGPVPGVFVAGQAQLAESLGWPIQAFRRCFRELVRHSMARADWGVRLVWLPRAIRHNPPQSPNVAQAWGRAFLELPECPLRAEAYASTHAFLAGLGEAFAEAFMKAGARHGRIAVAVAGAVARARAEASLPPTPSQEGASAVEESGTETGGHYKAEIQGLRQRLGWTP